MVDCPTVTFVILHNRDARRLNHIRPGVRSLAHEIGGKVHEIYQQPEIVPNTYAMTWRWVMFNRILGRRWAKYLGGRKIPGFGKFLVDLCINDTARIFKRKKGSPGLREYTARKMILTPKHIAAWHRFHSDSDYLVVLEDDAVFKKDTARRFVETVVMIDRQFHGKEVYADLAGGLDLAVIGVEHLMDHANGSYLHFSKPVTNTTCCYLLSAKTAKRFSDHLHERPKLRILSSDWLINYLFLDSEKSQTAIECIHIQPPVFNHGSFTGEYSSSLDC